MSEIKVIKPNIFGDKVDSFFTLRNERYGGHGLNIVGLNLGYNTNEDAHIISSNRNCLSTLLKNKSTNFAYANQVHGSSISYVTEAGTVEDCDALITQTKGLALAIQVADCAAVLIHDTKSEMIAAIHAGWRGAVDNIVPKTLKLMRAKGAEFKGAKAYISPCICKKHFEVGEEVADKFPASFVDVKGYAKPHIDLKGFIKSQLIENGFFRKNIETDSGCTIEGEQQFYSYRRGKEQSGRMMAVIQLK